MNCKFKKCIKCQYFLQEKHPLIDDLSWCSCEKTGKALDTKYWVPEDISPKDFSDNGVKVYRGLDER